MTMREPDGKHHLPCKHCGSLTWKRTQVCKRCESIERFDPTLFSEEQLVLCARELAKRCEHRAELLARVGVNVKAA